MSLPWHVQMTALDASEKAEDTAALDAEVYQSGGQSVEDMQRMLH
jgi:hypothetical protein